LDGLQKLYRRRRMTSDKAAVAEVENQKAREAAKPADVAPSMARRRNSASGLLGALPQGDMLAPAADDEPEAAPGETRDPYAELDVPPVVSVIEPLDPAVDMPEGLSFDVWDRLVEARNAKIASEEELKVCSATLAEMNAFFAMLTEEDEAARLRSESVAAELKARQKAELHETWDVELPFKLKQGQLEVEEAAVVTDFSDAALIHKSAVESLNVEIQKLAGEKVNILKEIRDFRRGIVCIQWENERAEREAEDLLELTKEFQLLRVTKDLQSVIKGGSEENQQVEVSALERRLEQLRASHEDKIADLKRQVAKVNRMVADKKAEMDSLSGQIEQLEGSVVEREMIYEVQVKNKDQSHDAYKRFEDTHMKRKLQVLVTMQTSEITLLREELDRLRRRTFPTFTHIEANRATDGVV